MSFVVNACSSSHDDDACNCWLCLMRLFAIACSAGCGDGVCCHHSFHWLFWWGLFCCELCRQSMQPPFDKVCNHCSFCWLCRQSVRPLFILPAMQIKCAATVLSTNHAVCGYYPLLASDVSQILLCFGRCLLLVSSLCYKLFWYGWWLLLCCWSQKQLKICCVTCKMLAIDFFLIFIKCELCFREGKRFPTQVLNV